jgi:hypothetical protein
VGHGPNRWQGFVVGIAGGAVGTVVMGGYWKAVTALAGTDPRAQTRAGGPHPLDDISLVGRHHGEEESSTAAMGRIAYRGIAGQDPSSDETKSLLSYLVHYGYGSLQGGVYGALSDGGGGREVSEGAAFGTGMWLLGDELAVSLLGLADGPGKYPLGQHAARWGAHVAYGLAAAATTATLRRLF